MSGSAVSDPGLTWAGYDSSRPKNKANGFEKKESKMGFTDYMQIGFFATLVIYFLYGFFSGYR